MVIPFKVWNVEKAKFNQMFKERRRVAQAAGKPFPSYALACTQLAAAVAVAEKAGEVSDVNGFWDSVFRPPKESRATKPPDELLTDKKKKSLEAGKQRRVEAPRPRPDNCEICGNAGRIMLDHDHKTGRFRGWICLSCNFALGFAKDDPAILQKLIDYLKATLD